MKFEAGEFYRMRNGGKAEVLAVWTRPQNSYQMTVAFADRNKIVSYTLNGGFRSDGVQSGFDLIEEWDVSYELVLTKKEALVLIEVGRKLEEVWDE